MTRALRRRHLWIFLLLAATLPLVFALALASRPPQAVERALPPALESGRTTR
jgi:hypothetical protein